MIAMFHTPRHIVFSRFRLCLTAWLFGVFMALSISPVEAFIDDWEERWEDVDNGFWIFGDVREKEKSTVNDYLKITRPLSEAFSLILESTLMRMELKLKDGFAFGPSFQKIGDFNDIYYGPFVAYYRHDHGRWHLYGFLDNMIEDKTDVSSWFLRGMQPLGDRGRFVFESRRTEQNQDYSIPYLLSVYQEDRIEDLLSLRVYYNLDQRYRIIFKGSKDRSSLHAIWPEDTDQNQSDQVRNWSIEPSVVRKLNHHMSLKITYGDESQRKITDRPGGATQVAAHFRIDHRIKRYQLELEHVRTPFLTLFARGGYVKTHDMYRSTNAADRHLTDQYGVTSLGCELSFRDTTRVRLMGTLDKDTRFNIDVMTLF